MHEYKIEKTNYFKWFQLIHAIPISWKKDIKIDQGNCRNTYILTSPSNKKQPNLLH